jgi:hypothetical protein
MSCSTISGLNLLRTFDLQGSPASGVGDLEHDRNSCILSRPYIGRAHQYRLVWFQIPGKIFAAGDLLNRFAILSEHVKLVPVIAMKMIVERLSADGASYLPIAVLP